MQSMTRMVRGITLVSRGIGQASNVPRASHADLEAAVPEFRYALQLEPDNHQASFDLAETLIKLNKTEEGVAILQTLAKNKDNYAHNAQRKLAKMNIPPTR